MASNKAFLDQANYESKPRRNSYDVSKSINMTGQLGGIYPCGVWEVNAGDSFRIQSRFAFNFFPTVFPLQTPLMARIYYFYGKVRGLWSGFKDFAYNNKQLVHPYINQPQGSFWKTGSLSDYLGVPTTYSSLPTVEQHLSVFPAYRFGTKSPVRSSFYSYFEGNITAQRILTDTHIKSIARSYFFKDDNYDPRSISLLQFIVYSGFNGYFLTKEDVLLFNYAYLDPAPPEPLPNSHYCLFAVPYSDYDNDNDRFLNSFLFGFTRVTSGHLALDFSQRLAFNGGFAGFDWFFSAFWLSGYQPTLGTDFFAWVHAFFQNRPGWRLMFGVCTDSLNSPFPESYPYTEEPFSETQYGYSFGSTGSIVGQLRDLSVLDVNPFAAADEPVIPLSAIPYRLYEALYNAYFRDEKNDPFKINGEIEYNKWNTTTADGPDDTPYKIYFRNWEADFLTTASQTPQQGLAPLVGINVRGEMEFLNDDGTISKIKPVLSEDGRTITGIDGVIENGTPEALRSAMIHITQGSGISINDFREVNSLQRWLEDNFRKGLRYRDQVMASTGVKIKYDELDMPVFLGSVSQPVTMTMVTQATPSTADDNALGDKAGQLGVFGNSKHTITHYCDEAGLIMAVVCITPSPVYSQLLPKYFLKSDALSYYHPQFGHIGMQPIDYREVCPIQAFKDGKNVFDVFGYQRAWYDLVGAVDEVHGQMRTTMRDFVMNRTFAGVPELGYDFLHIDPKQLNQVFAYTDENEDVFQGQIVHQVFVKRAIPRFGIPRLE